MATFFDPLWDYLQSTWEVIKSPRTRPPLMILVPLITVGTVFFHFVEHWKWIDSFYFCVVTLATVGFGDLSPETNVGKLFTTAYILLGIGILLSFLNAVAKHAFDQMAVLERGSKIQSMLRGSAPLPDGEDTSSESNRPKSDI
jgi:voltage-gated potassium channel